jgi:two-component system, OmpR family, sensor histidine kinase CssS
MRTLSSKISRPIISLFIIVPILIMLIFNVSARYFVNQATSNELKNVVQNIKTLSETILEKELVESGSVISSENIQRLSLIQAALRVSKYSMNTEMVIVNESGKVIFPQSYEDSFLNDALIRRAYLKSGNEEQLIRFINGGKSYMFISQNVDGAHRDYRVFFIASAASSDALIRFMNFVLVMVLIVSTIIAIGITLSLSKKISAPLVNAAKATHKVALGEYGIVLDDSDCSEVNALITGLNTMSKKLQASQEAQRSFLQNASHELRTPLMSIQGYAEGLSNGVFSETKEIADLISKESHRLNRLVDELLTLSRIESGNYTSDMQVVNLCDSMKDYIQRANGYALMEKKQIELDSPQEPLLIKVDDDLLFRAVYNVLTNAIKYASSKVIVTLSGNQSEVQISIKDDGEGLAQKDIPHLFDRFYKGPKGNFGLGLAIAKTSLEMLNGKISAENKDGALFIITLPRQ